MSLTETEALKYTGTDVSGDLIFKLKLQMSLLDHPYFTASVYMHFEL